MGGHVPTKMRERVACQQVFFLNSYLYIGVLFYSKGSAPPKGASDPPSLKSKYFILKIILLILVPLTHLELKLLRQVYFFLNLFFEFWF